MKFFGIHETLDSIAKLFKLFQDNLDLVNGENLINALKELKYDQQESLFYDIVEEVCSSNKNQLTYDEFVAKKKEQLQDRTSQKSTERTFVLFTENPDENLTPEDFKRVARETVDETSEEELKKIFNFASSNGKDIPFEEFHAIMTKRFGN